MGRPLVDNQVERDSAARDLAFLQHQDVIVPFRDVVGVGRAVRGKVNIDNVLFSGFF